MPKKMLRVLAAVAGVLALSGQAVTPAEAKPKQVTLFTGPVNTSFYIIGGYIATALNREGVPANSELGAALTNIMKVAAGDGEIGFTFAAAAGMAYNGEAPFPQKVSGFKALMTFQRNGTHVVVSEASGVKTAADLKGKKFSAQAVGNMSQTAFKHFLEGHGLKESDIDLAVGGQQFGADGTKDRRFVGFAAMSAYPGPVFLDVATSVPVRFLGTSDEVFARILKMNAGYLRTEIPAGTYPGQTETVPTFGTVAMMVVPESMPADDAYFILKTFAGDFETFKGISATLKELTPEIAAVAPGVPLHPGAERFWKEMGGLK